MQHKALKVANKNYSEISAMSENHVTYSDADHTREYEDENDYAFTKLNH